MIPHSFQEPDKIFNERRCRDLIFQGEETFVTQNNGTQTTSLSKKSVYQGRELLKPIVSIDSSDLK